AEIPRGVGWGQDERRGGKLRGSHAEFASQILDGEGLSRAPRGFALAGEELGESATGVDRLAPPAQVAEALRLRENRLDLGRPRPPLHDPHVLFPPARPPVPPGAVEPR